MGYVIVAALAIAVIGVIVKVLWDVRQDLRRDREEHGGRQTVLAAQKAWIIVGVIVLLVLFLIVIPLIVGADQEPVVP
jgi:hypothetical protein